MKSKVIKSCAFVDLYFASLTQECISLNLREITGFEEHLNPTEAQKIFSVH